MRIEKKSKWPLVRKLFNDVHLWLGLSSGLIVVLVCFSGTIYVFNTEFTEKGAPHLYRVSYDPTKTRIEPESLVPMINRYGGGRVTGIQIYQDPQRTYQFTVRKKGDKGRFGTTYMVDPYSGEIVGSSRDANGNKEFMSTMFSLHRWLLLDKIEKPIISGWENRELGSMITGFATIIFTLGCITGMVIWFPQKLRTWKQGLKIKWGANWKRVNHDLHNTLAFYSLIFLLIMGLTGPQWSFPWYREGLQKVLGTYKPEGRGREPGLLSSVPVNGDGKKMPLSELMKFANQQLAYRGDYMISLPADSASAVLMTKTRTGFFAPAAGDRLTFDQYSGELLGVEIFRDKPFNERIAGSIKALHVGNVYGSFTKIIYFLACLIATSLPVTGTLIWLNKMKKKRPAGHRRKQMPAASFG